jgi:hypothetical protein
MKIIVDTEFAKELETEIGVLNTIGKINFKMLKAAISFCDQLTRLLCTELGRVNTYSYRR